MKRCAAFIANVTLGLLALAGPAAAGAQNLAGGGDRAAVALIVMDAVTELKLCALAVEKSANADVKALCASASRDSARTALAGAQLARKLGATDVNLQPSPDTPALLDSLAQYSGPDFDRQFLLGQIDADETDERSIRYAVEVTTDDTVKRYENAVLPNVKRHLDLAENALLKVSEATP